MNSREFVINVLKKINFRFSVTLYRHIIVTVNLHVSAAFQMFPPLVLQQMNKVKLSIFTEQLVYKYTR